MISQIMFPLFCLMLIAADETGKQHERKFIIDNDAGGDDAVAIFLATLYEKYFDGPRLIAVSTVNGNTNEDNVNVNNQRILKVANRQNVPIYRGLKHSLVKSIDVVDYYGKDGLGDCGDNHSDLVPAQEKNAVLALIDLSKKHEGQITLLTIGPLTNIAMAIRIDPKFLERLNHLYIGAGHIHDAVHPNSEFNALMDVEAYHVVLEKATPDKVTLLPFSQARTYFNFSKEWRKEELGTINTNIIKAMNKYEQVAMKNSVRWQQLDPAVVAIAINEDLVAEYTYSKNGIILCGERRGFTTNEFVEKNRANVRIALKLKPEEYQKFLLRVFSKE